MKLIEDKYFNEFKKIMKKDTGKQYVVFKGMIEDNLKKNGDVEEIRKRIEIKLEILGRLSDDGSLTNYVQQAILIITVLCTIVADFVLEIKNYELNISFLEILSYMFIGLTIYSGYAFISKIYENRKQAIKIVYYKEILKILNE